MDVIVLKRGFWESVDPGGVQVVFGGGCCH